MNKEKGIVFGILILFGPFCRAQAPDVAIHVERAAVITFASDNNQSYKLLAAENASGDWATLKDGIAGTGGEVTVFYKSESNQKLFFKVEISDGPPGQKSLASLARLDVSLRDLTSYDLEGADLREYKFYSSILDNANLVATDLRGAGFQNASMKGTDLRNAVFDNTSFYAVNFSGANLSGLLFDEKVRLDLADFRNAILTGTRFNNAYLSRAIFAGVVLSNSSFRGSFLDHASFAACNLAGADLSRTDMSGGNVIGANLAGVNMEGAMLREVSMMGQDLRTVFLRGTHIGYSDWSNVNAAGTDLSFAYIDGGGNTPNLSGANFSGCNMEGFTVENPGFPQADTTLTGLNFRNANLRGAYFRKCKFRNTDFTGANLSFADFTSADLTGCTGFDPTQPGMQFGGTILPDGSTRNEGNPGTRPFIATLPSRLILNFTEGGTNNTLDLAFSFTVLSGNQFSHGVGAPIQGTYRWVDSGNPYLAALDLNYATGGNKAYTLLSTSPTEGKLFRNINRTGNAGIFQVGTFQVP
jgi:uncharacterized protein YjbI with pentapeptide repeats